MLVAPNPGVIPTSIPRSLSLSTRVDPCLSVVYHERSSRGIAISPSTVLKPARFLCNSKVIHSKGVSAPINPLESALTNSRSVFRISLKTNGRQALYNQHLRVFSSQVLYIQHLQKNRGGGRGSPDDGISQPKRWFGNRAPRLLTVLLFFVRANYSALWRSWQT